MFISTKTSVCNVEKIENSVFRDERGTLSVTYDKREISMTKDHVYEIVTNSRKNVFRGFHMQKNQEKIVTCMNGEIADFFY